MESILFRARFRYNFRNNTLFIKKFSFEEIFISQFFGRQTENNAPIRADYILSVRAAAADIFQIATAAHRFHNWVEQHHHFGANTQSVRIDRAPIQVYLSPISSPLRQYRSVLFPRRKPVTSISKEYSHRFVFVNLISILHFLIF